MAKGVLSFKIPEEQEEFNHAQLGGFLIGAAQELDNWFRSLLKHNPRELNEAEITLLEEARSKLHECFDGKIW